MATPGADGAGGALPGRGGGVGPTPRGAAAGGAAAADEAQMGQLLLPGADHLQHRAPAPAGFFPGGGDRPRAATSQDPPSRPPVPGPAAGLPGHGKGGKGRLAP